MLRDLDARTASGEPNAGYITLQTEVYPSPQEHEYEEIYGQKKGVHYMT